jgi:16S rRNA (guanine527-N7)-methyltransferase
VTEDRVVESGAAALGISLSPAQLAALSRYLDLVVEWSGRLRLTGARTRDEAARILVVGGLDVLPFLPETGVVADLGSGAGVPGILAAVLRPLARIVLVDASRKKAGFLEIAVRALGLTNAEVVCARAEALGRAPAHRARYDVVTARALADLRVLAEYALPLLRVGGIGVFPKGRTASNELTAAARALKILGATAGAFAPVPGSAPAVIVVTKRSPTPDDYPRRAGVAERNPM